MLIAVLMVICGESRGSINKKKKKNNNKNNNPNPFPAAITIPSAPFVCPLINHLTPLNSSFIPNSHRRNQKDPCLSTAVADGNEGPLPAA